MKHGSTNKTYMAKSTTPIPIPLQIDYQLHGSDKVPPFSAWRTEQASTEEQALTILRRILRRPDVLLVTVNRSVARV